MAEKYSLDRVLLKCRNLVKHNFLAVSKHPQFLHISPHTLARVLRIHDLIVYTEDDVFQALERWLAYDVDNRAEHALHLLRLVRLPTLPDSILLRVCRSPYFGGHNEFYQLLLEALIRRTEVRIVHAPRIASVQTTCRANLHTNNPSTSSTNPQSPVSLHFKPLGVTDNDLLPASPSSLPTSDGKTHPPSPRDEPPDLTIDYNRREDRAVLFEGLFPLRWYKSVRFRPRSASSLLFTVVIPKWSSCRRRFISESRSFLNHKWSMWVDPFSADPARGPAITREHSELSPVSKSLENKDANNLYVGDTIDRTTSTSSPTASSTPRPPSFSADDSDYISIYLCCESELGSSQKVDARVDFGLFVVSTSEEYGMERKVCVGRTFRSHGQAMGFRRHIRRNRMQSKSEGLYNAEKDELVVGAHLVAPDVMRPELVHSAFSQLSRASMTGDDFRSESPLSPSSGQLEASRLTTMDTEPSPILTATSRVTS